MLVCGLSLILQGLNFGVEFTGGTVFGVQTEDGTVEEARVAMTEAGVEGAVVQEINTGDSASRPRRSPSPSGRRSWSR